MKELSGFSQVIHSQSSNPLLFDGLAVKSEHETKLFLSSFFSEELEITMNQEFKYKEIRSMLYSKKPKISGKNFLLRPWDLVMISL